MCCTTLYHSHSRRWHALTQITARRSTSTACAASLPGCGHLRYAEGGHSTTGARGAMAINIELRPDEERALCDRARGSGRDVTEYVHQILQIAIASHALEEACAAADSLTRKVVIDEQQDNIDDAKLQLSRLVERALEGEDIIIVKGVV